MNLKNWKRAFIFIIIDHNIAKIISFLLTSLRDVNKENEMIVPKMKN